MLYTIIMAFTTFSYSYLFAGSFHPFQDKELLETQKLHRIYLFISTTQAQFSQVKVYMYNIGTK